MDVVVLVVIQRDPAFARYGRKKFQGGVPPRLVVGQGGVTGMAGEAVHWLFYV